eukprot:13388498-Alexandrium_andersonii.AAC.1
MTRQASELPAACGLTSHRTFQQAIDGTFETAEREEMLLRRSERVKSPTTTDREALRGGARRWR